MLLACDGALDLSSDVSMSSIEVNDIKKAVTMMDTAFKYLVILILSNGKLDHFGKFNG